MATFSNARVHYGLQITGTPTKTNVANDQIVGVTPTSASITGTVAGFSASGFIGASSGSLLINASTGLASNVTTPTAQVETATAAGTITASGNATVVVTGARITGSPVTVSVAVVNGDTAATWAGKVRTALAANAAISAVYTVGGSSTAISLTESFAGYPNDESLNISLVNGTCTGITPAATSADTTEAVAGEVLYNTTGDGNDCEGVAFSPLLNVSSIFIKCPQGGISVVPTDDAEFSANIQGGGFVHPYWPIGYSASALGDISISALEDGSEFEITVVGTR